MCRRVAAVVLLGLLAIFGCGVMFGQQKTITRADIPFEFYIDTLKFPPGTYYFQSSSEEPYLRIIKTGSQSTTLKMTRDVPSYGSAPQSKLLFSLENGKLVLHQVIAAGDNHAHDIQHSSAVPEMLLQPR